MTASTMIPAMTPSLSSAKAPRRARAAGIGAAFAILAVLAGCVVVPAYYGPPRGYYYGGGSYYGGGYYSGDGYYGRR